MMAVSSDGDLISELMGQVQSLVGLTDVTWMSVQLGVLKGVYEGMYVCVWVGGWVGGG
jgi:hypothetical protein